MLTRFRLLWVWVLLLLVSCMGANAGEDLTEQGRSAISGGSADTTHPAVMALINQQGGACSGTTIARRGQFGYLLTAAHCVVRINAAGNVIVPVQPVTPEDLLVLPGTDYAAAASSSSYYVVHGFAIPPQYTGNVTSSWDVAVVRYVGATASTPLIPAMTAAEDNLQLNQTLTYVGYGQTLTNPMNSVRYRVNKPIAALTTTSVTHNKNDGTGTCQGDSGGPAIRNLAAGERVAAVTSYSSGGDCGSGLGVSVRVSARQAFIDGFVNQAPGPVSCDTCRSAAPTAFGGCSAEGAACAQGSACESFINCATQCGSNASCVSTCGTQNPQGQTDYAALFDCACQDCPTECASEPACDTPSCGLQFSDTTCNSCNEAACCAQTTACANDNACRACATSATPAASCATDATYQAFRSCNLSQCATACGAPACGFSNAGACGTCISDSCCNEGTACQLDGVCAECATGNGMGLDCANNQAFNALFDCLGSCAGDPCMVGGAGGAAGSGGAGGSAGAASGGSGGSLAGAGGGAGSAGAASADGGTSLGGLGSLKTDSGGSSCGCRTAGAAKPSQAIWLLALLGLGLVVRRRSPRDARRRAA